MATASIFTNHHKHTGNKALLLIAKDIIDAEYQQPITGLRQKLKEGNKEAAAAIKRSLPAFTPAGIFEGGRKEENLKQYSGFIHLDFDHIPANRFQEVRQIIQACPYTQICFCSPSGDGLKVFVEVTSGAEHHPIAFQQVFDHYAKITGIQPDPSVKDLARLCYMSYDPETYKNLSAEKFRVEIPDTQLLEKHVPTDYSAAFAETVMFTENKQTYTPGNRNNFLYLLAANCNRHGLPEAHAISSAIEKYSDLSRTEVEACFRSAYKNNATEHNTKSTPRLRPIDTKSDTRDTKALIITASALLALPDDAPRYLLDPLLPAIGSAVLVGRPDTGKSQFARQLCIAVSQGSSHFLNYPLNTKHCKALYVATEDDTHNTRFLIEHQYSGLGQSSNENLSFLFADTITTDEIIRTISNYLTLNPCDLVIVDSFGDIFQGTDLNSNTQVRNTVKDFDRIAKKFNCLILFVHHINKSAYTAAPAQQHIQGGAGLAQKVRAALQLTSGEGDKKYLTVTKGNYCPREYKQNATELRFDETSFLFTSTGRMVPNSALAADTKSSEGAKYEELMQLATDIFCSSGNSLSYTAFVKAFEQKTGKSIPTAKRIHAQLKELNIITKSGANYILNPNPEDVQANEKETV